jgi:hypothetical protein
MSLLFISSLGKLCARIRTTNKHKANDPNPAHPDAQKHLASFLLFLRLTFRMAALDSLKTCNQNKAKERANGKFGQVGMKNDDGKRKNKITNSITKDNVMCQIIKVTKSQRLRKNFLSRDNDNFSLQSVLTSKKNKLLRLLVYNKQNRERWRQRRTLSGNWKGRFLS